MIEGSLREIDWRINPLYDVFIGLEAGFAAIQERMEGEEGFDGISARYHAEMLLGLGLVAAQAYVLGTWADVNSIRSRRGVPPMSKLDCYRCDPIAVKGGVTRIEAINAAANYFKHHDEWETWPTNETTRTLGCLGITEHTESPCIETVNQMCGPSWRLIVLHQIVREWRTHILSADTDK